ncbi:MAG: NAD(P) transhydrogenase subunit alpha [Rhodanobacteraceae bacterium]
MIDPFLALFIFMLAAFTGHEIISRVPVILHTPLMSGSNFVHGIVLVGAMIALASADSTLGKSIGFIGVVLGAGNAAGGYVVTERMLEMFKSSKSRKD